MAVGEPNQFIQEMIIRFRPLITNDNFYHQPTIAMLVVFITKCLHLYSSRKHKVEKNVASKVDWGGKKYSGIVLQIFFPN